jgi:hypothetical protein
MLGSPFGILDRWMPLYGLDPGAVDPSIQIDPIDPSKSLGL